MINELRYIFNESELATPRDRDGSMNSLSSSGLQGQLEHGIKYVNLKFGFIITFLNVEPAHQTQVTKSN